MYNIQKVGYSHNHSTSFFILSSFFVFWGGSDKIISVFPVIHE